MYGYREERKKTVEGRNLNVTCSYLSGKPPATMFYWTKTDSEFRSNGQFLWIPSIGREGSGTYTCFAENIYSSGNIGKANGTIEIDVQCQLINIFARYIIVYSIKANLTSL